MLWVRVSKRVALARHAQTCAADFSWVVRHSHVSGSTSNSNLILVVLVTAGSFARTACSTCSASDVASFELADVAAVHVGRRAAAHSQLALPVRAAVDAGARQIVLKESAAFVAVPSPYNESQIWGYKKFKRIKE